MTIIFVTFYGNGYGIIVPWGGDGACTLPRKKITRYKSKYLHHV